jgi:hypothetical protein
MRLPTYETTTKPWFGPRSRARSALGVRTFVSRPRDALNEFAAVLGRGYRAVQHVRFVDFYHRDEKFRYTIAILFTRSHSDSREVIYDLSDACVQKTGWYPLVQGERLSSRFSRAAFLDDGPWSAQSPELRGELLSVESAVAPTGGCSIRAQVGQGSVVFDTGFPNKLSLGVSDKAVLLSHTHADHAGGFVSGATGSLPVLMSTATAQLLQSKQPGIKDRLRAVAVLADPAQRIELGADAAVFPFAVPHLPGAVGYELRVRDRSLFSPEMSVYVPQGTTSLVSSSSWWSARP